MRLAIVTDAWLPQTNGVVRTLSVTSALLQRSGHVVEVLEPRAFRTLPCPTYPEIRLAWRPYRQLAAQLAALDPDSVHIATEGPLGMAARRWCLRQGRAFTTSYHTRFPEYVRARAPIPLRLGYAHLRRFHGAAARTLVGIPHAAGARARPARLPRARAALPVGGCYRTVPRAPDAGAAGRPGLGRRGPGT